MRKIVFWGRQCLGEKKKKKPAVCEHLRCTLFACRDSVSGFGIGDGIGDGYHSIWIEVEKERNISFGLSTSKLANWEAKCHLFFPPCQRTGRRRTPQVPQNITASCQAESSSLGAMPRVSSGFSLLIIKFRIRRRGHLCKSTSCLACPQTSWRTGPVSCLYSNSLIATNL